ncbi:uncharacterized protein LOC129759967 [Uranotaenia lowii]|uniref:uncharacterized protein LOC129759967 n=1 Tax=Uranotaenia lowii TaxID=190385 RepID=UPI00247AEE75|nr:uncharacterized protein LOC129759967 [Uranotaenia lowii]
MKILLCACLVLLQISQIPSEPISSNPFWSNYSNSDDPSGLGLRRSKRQIIPSLPSIPIPSISGTSIIFGDRTIELPEVLSNVMKSMFGKSDAWEFVHLLTKQRWFPVGALELICDLILAKYQLFGKSLVASGMGRLNSTLDFFSWAVSGVLDSIQTQLNKAVDLAATPFQYSWQSVRECMRNKFREAGQGVVNTTVGCIRKRWIEAQEVVQDFSGTVTETDTAFEHWLDEVTKCCEIEDKEEERECYAKAITNPALKILKRITPRWIKLTLQISATIAMFQPKLEFCAAELMVKLVYEMGKGGIGIASCMWG